MVMLTSPSHVTHKVMSKSPIRHRGHVTHMVMSTSCHRSYVTHSRQRRSRYLLGHVMYPSHFAIVMSPTVMSTSSRHSQGHVNIKSCHPQGHVIVRSSPKRSCQYHVTFKVMSMSCHPLGHVNVMSPTRSCQQVTHKVMLTSHVTHKVMSTSPSHVTVVTSPARSCHSVMSK